MRLILHVGHPKTGTSYLQNTLAMNHARLHGHGLLYPVDFTPWGGHNYHDLAVQNRVSTGNADLFYRSLLNKNMAWITQWLAQAEATGCDHVVLSSESFFYSPEPTAALVQLFRNRGHSATIFASIPKLEKGVIAAHSQAVRNHMFSRDVYTFLFRKNLMGNFRFASAYKAMARITGTDDLVFIPYARSGIDGKGIVHDFLTACSLPAMAPDLPSDVNRSLSAEAVYVAQLVNGYGDRNYARTVVRKLALLDTAGTSAFDFFLTRELQGFLWRRFGTEMEEMSGLFTSWVGKPAVDCWMEKSVPQEIGLDPSYLERLLREVLSVDRANSGSA